MKIEAGQKAPDFTLIDANGDTIDLKALRGQKVYVSFFRNTACPFCNLRIVKLTKALPAWQKQGLKVIFFFESNNRVIKRSTFCDTLPGVHLVGDPERKIYNQYGIASSLLKTLSTPFQRESRAALKEIKELGIGSGSQKDYDRTLIPGDFLIDESGTVIRSFYGKNLNDRIPMEEIERFVGRAPALSQAS
ncbi:MAG: redoxin domain-containing protein [Bacteroidota bacterium]